MIKEIPCAIITKLDYDLIKIVYKDNYQVELDDAKMVDATFQEFYTNKPLHVLMDTKGRYSVFSSEAQRFFTNEAPMTLQNKMAAFAILIDSLPNRLLVKFYLVFFRPRYPFEIFSKEEDALAFLNALRKKKS